MTRQTYKRYLEIVKKDVLTESEINILKRLYVKEPDDVIVKILTNFVLDSMKESYRITDKQTEKGIRWLKNHCFKKNGEIRRSKSLIFDREECRQIREILDDFSHWTFEGFSHGNPLYEMHSKSGKTLMYSVSPRGY